MWTFNIMTNLYSLWTVSYFIGKLNKAQTSEKNYVTQEYDSTEIKTKTRYF